MHTRHICGEIKVKEEKNYKSSFNTFIEASCGVGAENLLSLSALAESITDCGFCNLHVFRRNLPMCPILYLGI